MDTIISYVALENVFTCCFVCCLVRHCYTDFKEMLLYDSINLVLLCLGLVRAVLRAEIGNALAGMLVLGGLMLLIYWLARGGMGEGDVKLAAVLGLWLGVEQGLVGLLLAFISGAIFGLLLLFRSKASAEHVLPFGPFLCLGAVISCFFGNELLSWYGQFF
ncbi:MAG: A24 family peptidase [Phascolarctobacterium sp.]|nr:A24 family peptidase [Phascolarctobacterium sp.]